MGNHDHNLEVLVRELRARNSSPQTVKIYTDWNRRFLSFIKKNPKEVRGEDVKKFLAYLNKKKFSSNTVASAYNALKFFYEEIWRRRYFKYIKAPRRSYKTPDVLTKEEIKQICKQVKNIKYRLMLNLLYSSGLRVKECVKVKVKDLEFSSKRLKVRGGKGKKDRYTVLSKKLGGVLKKFIKGTDGNDYVFPSSRGGHLHVQSLQQTVKRAVISSKIKKKASCHTMRHSFATHMIENGVNLRYVQECMGHENVNTTEGYTKVTSDSLGNIDSPMDI